jgi:putative toxin-antitoxin system antitoxin component (TIGR02293 family)
MNINAPLPTGYSFHDLEKGVTARRVQKYLESGELFAEDVYRVVPERTFKRRLTENAKLRLEEADAILRLLRVRATAIWAFSDVTKADAFLSLANPSLGNRIPRNMSATDAGARDVEGLLHRFVFGDIS